MIEKTIGQLTNMIQVENDLQGFLDVTITGVCIDTRKIEPGNLFIPFKGEKVDGHQYVEAAFENGAKAALWQKDVPNPPEHIPVLIVEDTLLALQQLARSYRNDLKAKIIGITGSNGKTTTKDIAAAVFAERFIVHKTDGNFNNHIGLPLTILGIAESTEVAILEMGMSGKGEISLLTEIARPDAAIITNIGEAHLQDLGSRDAIAEAKLEIIEGLSDDGVLVYPGAEPLLATKVEKMHSIRTITFGDVPDHDFYVDQIKMDEKGCTFTVPRLSDQLFYLPISGEHNVLNALAVLSVANEMSLTVDEMNRGLNKVTLSHMRMEWREGYKGIRILNDAYNASPTSMRAVISMVAQMDDSKEKILVLGDMLELGDQEIAFHEQIGKGIDPNKIKYVYTYGHLGKYISEGAARHFSHERVFHFTEKTALIESLKGKLAGEEIILFKASRGMMLEEMIEMLVTEDGSRMDY